MNPDDKASIIAFLIIVAACTLTAWTVWQVAR